MAKNREVPVFGTLTERDISDYARFFEKNHLEEMTIEEKGLRVNFRKQKYAPAPVAVSASAPPAPQAAAPSSSVSAPAEEAKAEKKSNYKEVRSPIVGTFYASPAPGAGPFVKVGDTVTAETKVCIVEAMKVMNEITAGVSGKIVECLVQNGQTVTANQVLMHVE